MQPATSLADGLVTETGHDPGTGPGSPEQLQRHDASHRLRPIFVAAGLSIEASEAARNIPRYAADAA